MSRHIRGVVNSVSTKQQLSMVIMKREGYYPSHHHQQQQHQQQQQHGVRFRDDNMAPNVSSTAPLQQQPIGDDSFVELVAKQRRFLRQLGADDTTSSVTDTINSRRFIIDEYQQQQRLLQQKQQQSYLPYEENVGIDTHHVSSRSRQQPQDYRSRVPDIYRPVVQRHQVVPNVGRYDQYYEYLQEQQQQEQYRHNIRLIDHPYSFNTGGLDGFEQQMQYNRRFSLSGNGGTTDTYMPALTLQELDKIDTSQQGALFLDARIYEDDNDKEQQGACGDSGDKLDKFDYLEESIQNLKRKRQSLLLGKLSYEEEQQQQLYKKFQRRDSLYSLSHSRRSSLGVSTNTPSAAAHNDNDDNCSDLQDTSDRTETDLLNVSLYPLGEQSIRDYVNNESRLRMPRPPSQQPEYQSGLTYSMVESAYQQDQEERYLAHAMSMYNMKNRQAHTTTSRNIDTTISLKRTLDSFTSAMNESLKSQQCIHEWDKKMGLKRSHSKTMRLSMRTRKKLRLAMKKDMIQTISSLSSTKL